MRLANTFVSSVNGWHQRLYCVVSRYLRLRGSGERRGHRVRGHLLPRLASTDLRILDGQHRILGVHLAIEGISDDLEKARSGLSAARRNDAEPAVIQQFQEKINALNEQRERFDRERT